MKKANKEEIALRKVSLRTDLFKPIAVLRNVPILDMKGGKKE
tara:strand:+ start:228 stop:353 length:126 start_codon:yes stop_codon:yes gene_type:complete